MTQAKAGDAVKVHYTGTLPDGTVFDSSESGEPLAFTIGSRLLIPGFEDAVVGMSPGESRKQTIPAGEAYGTHDAELVLTVDRAHLPPEIKPAVGDRLELQHPDGNSSRVTVTEITGGKITLDANHPLAGKDLVFEIRLVEIG